VSDTRRYEPHGLSARTTRLGTVTASIDTHWAMFSVISAAVILAFFEINLRWTPDFLGDEVIYAKAGFNIFTSDAISGGGIGAILVHPPVYFFVLGVWEWITGNTSQFGLAALQGARTVGAAMSAVACLLTALTVRELLPEVSARRRVLAGVSAMGLVATNGFVLSFGRTALIDPGAVAAGALVVYLALRVSERSPIVQVLTLGPVIGVGCLVKQIVIFAALSPILWRLLLRVRRDILTQLWALVVGALIWLAFPLWAAFMGISGQFWLQQTFSLKRLLGIVKVTGVTLPGASPLTQFTSTFDLYVVGYLVAVLGGVGFLLILKRAWSEGKWFGALTSAQAMVISYTFLTYLFVGFSVLFGAANQQFSVYIAGSSAVVLIYWFFAPKRIRPGRAAKLPGRRNVLAALTLLVVFLIGVLSWALLYPFHRDDATYRVATYLNSNLACQDVNATGQQDRWQIALPANHVQQYSDGPTALAAGVHIFLVSEKDARLHYGNMSPELSSWIQANGRLLFQASDRGYEGLGVWQVGRLASAGSAQGCAVAPGPVASHASGITFLITLLGVGILVELVAFGAWRASAARRARSTFRSSDERLDQL